MGSLPYLRTRLQQEHAEVRQCDPAFVSFLSANCFSFLLQKNVKLCERTDKLCIKINEFVEKSSNRDNTIQNLM